jgi:23S rRNA pseudouridine1911/1915/1917 synthase
MEEEVKIIFEDSGTMVVDKPAGLVTTNEGRMGDHSLESWSKERGNNVERGGVVHRLDKNTSGLIIIAKNDQCWLKLKKQFHDRLVEKTYVALVPGGGPGVGQINMPIGRRRVELGKFGVSEEGRAAFTSFKVVGRYKDVSSGKIYSLVEVKIKTGRTHQIRVHLSFLKLPIVGDRLYGGEKIEGLSRQFLHAKTIRFSNPVNNSIVDLESELASDLAAVLNRYEKIQ